MDHLLLNGLTYLYLKLLNNTITLFHSSNKVITGYAQFIIVAPIRLDLFHLKNYREPKNIPTFNPKR